MACLEFSYYSKALKSETAVNVLLPEVPQKKPGAGLPPVDSYKTLYLLHGLSGDHTSWMRYTSIERYAADYGIAVVMPEVGRSWYTDTASDAAYFSFVTEELPEVCCGYFKGMSAKREDNYIAGLSMGGYGALKAALFCPEKYIGCASLSGSIDITRRLRSMSAPVPLNEWRAIFDFDLHSPVELENTPHDLFAVTKKNKDAGIAFPKLYLWCGTEDSLIVANRAYRDLLQELALPHRYEESTGDHTWKWWDLHIQDALAYLFSE